ncbi:MAG: SMP-30/gluconolactonase/LRE family protein [Betaproteobacteria bacterium]|nr:SMP-30/gluconolactonase/LRE family protein [Betaproteobacteria bacterium]
MGSIHIVTHVLRRLPPVLLLCTGSALAQPRAGVALDEPAFYPEGPAVVGKTLFWAEMSAHRIRKHADGVTETVWTSSGCGPTSVKFNGRDGFWILCHLAHRVVRVDCDFRTVATYERDVEGSPLAWPNDATVDEAGRLYFTSAGLFDLAAPASGAVYFVDSDGRVRKVADGFRYANGIVLDRRRKRLYVSEHLNRRVHVLELKTPHTTGRRSVFVDLDRLPVPKPGYPLAGPDGLFLHRTGDLYIAEYGAGRVLVVARNGRLKDVIPVPMPFVTNVVFWEERRQFVITGAFRNDVPPMRGRVISVAHRQ